MITRINQFEAKQGREQELFEFLRSVIFQYRLWWADNGRAVVLEKQFVELPKVVR